MSRAEELAQAYADAVSTHRLESLYGTSKSYTLEKARERDEAHAALSTELRRLSAVETELEALKKAIGDAEPVAWANFAENRNVRIWSQKPEESSWSGLPLTALYTLKGIK